jgi:1-acyl-sn-glycerol-3-phosphate acyltransferase
VTPVTIPSERGPVWGHRLGWLFAHGLWNTTVVGAERLPRTGPVVVAANHSHFVDGPLLIGACPRPLHIMVKEDMYHSPLGLLFTVTGQIRTDRSNGRRALATGLGVLRQGGAVGIFPEGSRGAGDMGEARAGAAWLAVNGAAPVVPVALLGTRAPGASVNGWPPPRRRFHMEFGEPITPAVAGLSRRAAVTAATEQIRVAMAELVAAAADRTGYVLPGPLGQGQ